MRTPPRHARRRGFTLIELLVVVGIIAILITLVGVVASRAFSAAGKVKLGAQLQIVEQALEAYKTDFGNYPVTSAATPAINDGDDTINALRFRGARTLCKALIGATPQGDLTVTGGIATFDSARPDQDGAEGFGFRIPSRSGQFKSTGVTLASGTSEMAGKVYGPYLSPDQFKLSKTHTVDSGAAKAGDLDESNPGTYDDSTVLLDANERPILYYPVLNAQPAITVKFSFIGPGPVTGATPPNPTPMYRTSDNNGWWAVENDFATIMGDTRDVAGSGGADGAISPSTGTLSAETATVRGKYLLWTSGPDKRFGYNLEAKPQDRLDDVANFDFK